MVLAALPDRTKATLVTWLTNTQRDSVARSRPCAPIMWDAYVTAVREVMPHATIVIDRFHGAITLPRRCRHLRKQECSVASRIPPETRAQLKHPCGRSASPLPT